MSYDLNRKVAKDIKGVPGGYAIGYDPGNDDIYFGGHDGIYKYNFLTKSAEFFAEEGKSIWGLFIRNNFYYIDYPMQKLHVYIDDKFVKVAEAVNIEIDNFFVTKQKDIYFSNKTALYKVDKITRSTIVLDDDIAVRQIVDDSYDMQIRLLFLLITSTSCIQKESCDRLKIGENWYEREILVSDLGRPYNLNIHKATNTLFFSYTQPETYSDVDFQLAYYNLDSNDYHNIIGIRGGCAVAIDQASDVIYLGGSEGIYKYNMLTRLADVYKEDGVNIWSLFYRRNLFYISYPDQRLYMEFDGTFVSVKEFNDIEIDHFHINNDNDIYFSNKTGLYKTNNSAKNIEVVNDLILVRQIVEDVDENLYVCSNLGLYLVRKHGIERISDIKNVHGLTFDRDNNYILSDEKNIMKLIYSKSGCMVVDNNRHWNEDHIVRKVLSMDVDEYRGRGRPKKLWMDCVKDDMAGKNITCVMTSDSAVWEKKTCCADAALS
ncbi:uncharacterized protein LOC113396032 [Vanessa tameamea]|uniref:Uncharacterized protein LOC113396032 n=1 Tax=Vanessa tameamea TaxID=334116 RepID=A0ABM4AU10_VANTA